MGSNDFEKLWLALEHMNTGFSNIAVANAPDNYSKCSLILSVHGERSSSFAHALLSKEETIKVRDALTAVINDMQ